MSSVDCLKLENNLCRCCHAEGCFKTLGVIIGSEGREVYADMLRDYLDVNLTPVPGPLCLVTYTICEECVQRLYDAVDFKKQILECEEKFRDMYRRDVIKACKPDLEVKVEVDTTDIPSTFVEELKVECPPETNYINENEDDTDFEFQDNVDVELDTSEETPKEQDTTKEQDSNKEENGKKKEKGKGKAVKTGKKVGRPKKSVTADGEKKTKKDPMLGTPYSLVEHDDGVKYMCLECNKLLNSPVSLKKHFERLHAEIKCPLCDEKFQILFKKKQHLMTAHGMEEYGKEKTLRPYKKYVCQICNKELINRTSLNSHVKRLHKTVKCPDCELSVVTAELILHRHKIHGHPIPTCGICGYKSAKSCNVTIHQRKVHLKEKNISCEYCGKEFFHIGYLRRHVVIHTSERKFECSYCHKRFPRKPTLELHEKIHTGVKNKVCTVCDERFVQKASLNYHMARRHPGVSF